MQPIKGMYHLLDLLTSVKTKYYHTLNGEHYKLNIVELLRLSLSDLMKLIKEKKLLFEMRD